ncbi:MAG: response regulator [Myxococcales bacterium]
MEPIRVLLADDHALVRAGIRSLLESLGGVEVAGEAGNGHEALALLRERKPEVAFLDISMPGLNGLEVTERAMKEGLRTRVIILSMYTDDEFIRRAFRAGALGYLLKNADRGELELALRAVADGEAWLSPAISKKVIAALSEDGGGGKDKSEVLTPRQREILQLIAEGHSTKEIAYRLELSAKTVETHRMQIMERLGIHGVAGLVRFALRSGIVRDD